MNNWDTSFNDAILRELDAQNAYQPTKEPPMAAPPPKIFRIDPIVAGVRACMLAAEVLRMPWENVGHPDARLAVASAQSVLECWGIEIKTDPLPETAPAEPPAATLVWPPVDRLGRPLSTVLPDVYRENYYHVREPVTVVDSTDATHGVVIYSEHRLVLHESYWNEESLQWRMRFSNASMPGLEKFWVDHCKVRVGDEIPKIIDASTQARSNDP